MKDKHRKEKDMPDEVGTEATRSDAPSLDDDLFGDAAADDKAAVSVDEQNANGEAPQDAQGSDDAAAKAPQDTQQDSNAAEEPADAEAEAASTDDLKVVVSIKGGRATIGVQKPSADPHIETFDGLDEIGLTTEVPAVIERARARWEETPKHPAYERPAPPARRRNRRQQGAAQDAAAETQEAETQQQTLRLF